MIDDTTHARAGWRAFASCSHAFPLGMDVIRFMELPSFGKYLPNEYTK